MFVIKQGHLHQERWAGLLAVVLCHLTPSPTCCTVVPHLDPGERWFPRLHHPVAFHPLCHPIPEPSEFIWHRLVLRKRLLTLLILNWICQTSLKVFILMKWNGLPSRRWTLNVEWNAEKFRWTFLHHFQSSFIVHLSDWQPFWLVLYGPLRQVWPYID